MTIPDSVFIRAGYSANAEIVLKQAENVMTIPESAVEFSGDSAFVYLLKEEKPKQLFEKHAIKTGLSDGIKIEITDGLKNENRIRGAVINKEK